MTTTPGAVLDGLRATLGSVELGAVNTDGVAHYLQILDGWDSPDSRSEFTEREADHGTYASPVYLSSRPVTLAGTLVAPSRDALEAAMDSLRAAAALTDTTLTVWESQPRQAQVRRSGKPLMQYVTDTTATYSVMVTAADPRRYGTVLHVDTTSLPSTSGGLVFPVTVPITFSGTVVSGQITATNVGSMDTRPVLSLTGPVVQPIVSAAYEDGSVRQLIYTQDLQAGDVLVVDTDSHAVTLNGAVSRRRFMTVPSGWPTIPPEQTVSYQFQSSNYNATAQLTASWRSAWL